MAYITVGTGEGSYQVWQDDPVPARLDPELPQPDPPPPAPTATSTTASNNAATTGNGTSTPAGNQSTPTATSSTVDITAQIRGEVSAGPKDNQGYLNLLLNKYSAADLARAYPEFGDAEDYQAAKDGLPKGLIVPGSLDAEGRLQAVRGTTEFFQAEQLVRQASRDAIRKAAIANGFPPDAAIPTAGDPTTGRVYITLENGKDIDITSYFEGVPKSPVAIPLNVPTYGTSTVTTPFREVTIQGLPTVALVVNTSQGEIKVDANSDVAKFLQWQGSQYDPVTGGTIGESWARAGIANPYSNPTLVQTALELIDRRPNGKWSDPNWPEYQGSNREAYESASLALTDLNYQQQLKAENGWDQATFDSWALRATNPEEWGRQAAAASAAAGLVVGPGPSGTTGLSANGATVVATNGSVNSSGFANATFSSTASLAGVPTDLAGATGAVTDAANNLIASVPSVPTNLAGVAAGFAAGFTAALPELPSVEGALRLTAAQVTGLAQQAEDAASAVVAGIRSLPERIPDSLTGFVTDAVDSLVQASGLGAVTDLLSRQNATIRKAKEQATLQARNNEAAAPDWRVRLQLAPGATYLYKDPVPGILAPLVQTDGIIFPYTPTIETSYAANYDKYDLTHSNYRGYFYKNSVVNDISIRGVFTAQDTAEAEYMLAVIHFFRSVTRMFYGQDALRGAPPPLVYLSGFGEYQFSEHPCLVSNFSYSLPNEVDYIRAWAPNNYGNLFSQRAKTGGTSTSPFGAVLSRLTSIGVPVGAEPSAPTPSNINQNVNNLTEATYVPTKIEINITLLPTNTRSQVSQQFSVKEFANGSLLKGGFW